MTQTNTSSKPHKYYVPLWQKILRTAALTIVLATVLLGALLPPVIRYGRKQEALGMLGKAKNIEFAMRLVSMDYYGKEIRIWAPQEADGLTEEAQEEIVQMAGTDGQIILLEWSEEEMRPMAFLYTEGKHTVRFDYDLKNKTGSWEVYRAKRVLEFGN